MFRKFPAFFCCLTLLAAPVFADEEESELESYMSDAGRSLKLLRRAGDDHVKAAGLVQKAQEGLLASFPIVPPIIEKMPEGKERQLALANYRKTMAESYAKLCVLEIAYLNGNQDEIDAAMEEVKASRKKGHNEFIEEE